MGYDTNIESWKMKKVIENDLHKKEIGIGSAKLKWASGYRISDNVAVPLFNVGLAFGLKAVSLEFRGK